MQMIKSILGEGVCPGGLEAESEAGLCRADQAGWWESTPLRPVPMCQVAKIRPAALDCSKEASHIIFQFWNDHSGFWAETGPAHV